MQTVDSSVKHVKLPVCELKLGMYVSELDIPWLESPFLFQGFVIERPDQLEELREVCRHVVVDLRLSSARAPAPAPDGGYAVPVEGELEAAHAARRTSRQLIRRIFREIELGRGLDGALVREVVVSTVDSVLRNPDALLLLTQIKNKDEYTAEHCTNVSVLSATFARHLELSRAEIEVAAYCGLLHDIGKIRVPDAVLNKTGRFNTEEYAIMCRHPAHGRDVLLASDSIIPAAIDVAFAHHERVDGAGYPRSVPREKLPYYARLVAITDAYDAITSNRCYQQARSSFDALGAIYESRDSHFDARLAERFIECIGVYPAGSIVEMSNGEVGIVLSVHPAHRLQPRLILVREADGQPGTERIIDLRRKDLDASGAPYKVRATHPNGAFGVDLRAYIERGLRIGEQDPAGR